MDVEALKQQAAAAALAYVEDNTVVGVGSGSTVHYFIEALASQKGRIEGAIASSQDTENKLRQAGIPVLDLNGVDEVPLYVDGADEVDHRLYMIKGGGAALTREKIIAAASQKMVCIAHQSKYVPVLGEFPLPIEVIPMARSYVARQLVALGGRPEWRQDTVTDNGNIILDVYRLCFEQPIRLERKLNDIAGVVTVGLFALRPADILLLAKEDGVATITVS